MRVYVDPIPSTLSRAMHRVAGALKAHAPDGLQFVDKPEESEFQVLHAIGPGAWQRIAAPRYGVIQYCLNALSSTDGTNVLSGGDDRAVLDDLWQRSEIVWSYYDLNDRLPIDMAFYHAPLGVDRDFRRARIDLDRPCTVMTTGYLHGPGAEAIEEPALAVERLGGRTIHLNPRPVGMKRFPTGWHNVVDVTDEELAILYGRCQFVSGLRHLEGFELPVIEGLACGARPIVFDRPEMRDWFDGHAIFVPECEGEELIDRLTDIFKAGPEPVTEEEKSIVLDKFDWATLATGFWAMAMQELAR